LVQAFETVHAWYHTTIEAALHAHGIHSPWWELTILAVAAAAIVAGRRVRENHPG